MDDQECGASQTGGHQQPQGGRQKKALWIRLPQAPRGGGHRVRAVRAHSELASHAHVAGRAGADQAREVGVATASMRAGAGGAGVGAFSAVAPAEAQRTGAAARAAALHARAAVGTGAAGAVVQVVLAARPGESRATAAAQRVAQVQAEAAILTWLQATAVHPLLTVRALETRWAMTDIGRVRIFTANTQAAIEAGSICARDPAHLTSKPVESPGTGTFKGARGFTTAAPIGTWVPITRSRPR